MRSKQDQGSFLTLASRSPQRRAILEQLGVGFTVVPAEITEINQGEPGEIALLNATVKAGAVSASCVVGADTVVALGEVILPKPNDVAEARLWLESLSGVTHEVFGGLCVNDRGQERGLLARTLVTFRTLSKDDIEWYLASGEWRDRAGGYAIQGRGAALVQVIEGEYLNVVGISVVNLLTLIPDLLQRFSNH
ncbi:MAG: Maf family protein [Actinomycetota bacterium]